MSDPSIPVPDSNFSLPRYTLGFILIGLAWGFTTPFIRRAARTHKPPPHPILDTPRSRVLYINPFWSGGFAKNPKYAIPLVINLTGSIWFFLLIGQAELSLTIPITNSLAFLFTVLGDWYVDGKIISKNTWAGMALSLAGIIICVQSKSK
ncbi:integral membrane protein [Blumeria hordei DH14]|uniref:Integral membrane protein n=1 Tax=Blumeria graminis f. sp. hordei (strain DH14) TaxID=546991 RepID=N1JC56_BLUG1|nr:integral membrane protein [Blumeria hordei DH14]